MREARNSMSMLSLCTEFSLGLSLVVADVCVPSTSPLRVGHGLDRRVSGVSWVGGGGRWLYTVEPLAMRQWSLRQMHGVLVSEGPVTVTMPSPALLAKCSVHLP